MSKKSRLLLSAGTVAALSACGSTTGTTASTDAPALSSSRLYSSDVGTASEALAAGNTLSTNATTVSAVSRDLSAGTTAPTTASVTLSRNSKGGLTLTVDGVSQEFAASDLSSDGYSLEIKGGGKHVLISTVGKVQSPLDQIALSNTDYAQVWEFFTNQIDATGTTAKQGFMVVGTETKPEDMKSLPTATYAGEMKAKLFPSTGFQGDPPRLRGDLSMTADFGAGAVSGSVGNLQYRTSSTSPWGSNTGTIAMNSAAISGNGFSGTMTPDAAYTGSSVNPTITSGTYSGTFFGPKAEQIGGAVSMQGSNGGSPYNGSGFFVAGQTSP